MQSGTLMFKAVGADCSPCSKLRVRKTDLRGKTDILFRMAVLFPRVWEICFYRIETYRERV